MAQFDMEKLSKMLFKAIGETGTAFVGALSSDVLLKGLGKLAEKTSENITPAQVQRLTLWATGRMPHDDEEIIEKAANELSKSNISEVLAWNRHVGSIKDPKTQELYRLIVVGAPDPDLSKAKDDERRIKSVKETIMRVGPFSSNQFKAELKAKGLDALAKKAQAQYGIFAKALGPIAGIFTRANDAVKQSRFADNCKAFDDEMKRIEDLF